MSIAPETESGSVCSVAPLLSVRNGAGAVEFYQAAFGAMEVYRLEDPFGHHWEIGHPLPAVTAG